MKGSAMHRGWHRVIAQFVLSAPWEHGLLLIINNFDMVISLKIKLPELPQTLFVMANIILQMCHWAFH